MTDAKQQEARDEQWTAREEEVISELMQKQELSRHAVLRQGLRLFQMLVENKILIRRLPGDSNVPISQRLEAMHEVDMTCKFPSWAEKGDFYER